MVLVDSEERWRDLNLYRHGKEAGVERWVGGWFG